MGEQMAARAPVPRPAAGVSPSRVGVLIVEDEDITRRAMASLIAASGYSTRAVRSAEEAMDLLQTWTMPSVALIDLHLPGASGLELLDRLSHLSPAIRAVLLTSASGEALVESLKSRGVTYLRKPIDFDRLLQVITEGLRSN